MEESKITFIESPRGGRFLCIDNHTYRVSKKVKDEKLYWMCRNSNCKATATTVKDELKMQTGEHNHPSELVKDQVTTTGTCKSSSSHLESDETKMEESDNEENTDRDLKDQMTTTSTYKSSCSHLDTDEREMEESDNEERRDLNLQTQASQESLTSNPAYESGPESEEECDENTHVGSSQNKSVKFVQMNLYKLKPFPSEMKKTAEEIISNFKDKIGKCYDRKRKATEKNVHARRDQNKRFKSDQNKIIRSDKNKEVDFETERDSVGTAEIVSAEYKEQIVVDKQNTENEDENEDDIESVHDGSNSESEDDIASVHDGSNSENEDDIASVHNGSNSENEDDITSVQNASNSENEDGIASVHDWSNSENEDEIEVGRGKEEACMFKPQELLLTDDTIRLLSGHPSNFKLRLYGLSTPSSSQMTRAVSNIVKGPNYVAENTIRSFFLFFYRKQNNDDPEIYVMTSGQGYRFVEKRACTQFPAKVARRILKFKSIDIVTRNVTGDTSQKSQRNLPDSEGTLNIWDLVTAIVNSYTAFPKVHSSIYSLKCFRKRNGQPKEVTLSMRKKSIKVNQSTSIEDLLDIVNHFADIDQGLPTKTIKVEGSNEGDEEKDDPLFDQFHYIQEVTSPKVKRTLNKNLDKWIQRLLRDPDQNEDLTMSMENMLGFVNAEKYFLFIGKKKRHVHFWEGKPPVFSEILNKVKSHLPCRKSKITWNMLKSLVKISLQETKGKRYPIQKLLVQGYVSSSQPYFLWHGKWLKIRFEYQDLINKNFLSILNENTIDAKVMYPLSWEKKKLKPKKGTSQKGKTNKQPDIAEEIKSKFKLGELTSFLEYLGHRGTDDLAREVLNKVGTYDEVNGICIYKPDDYGAEPKQDDPKNKEAETDVDLDEKLVFAKIFLRLHSTIDEFTFNKTYLLLDYVLRKRNHPKRFVVGDRLCSHHIELFDVLAYSEKDTYLVHLKTGFDKNVRELCAQVRNSADQLHSDLFVSKSQKILDQWWDVIHNPIEEEKEMAKYKKAVQESCSTLGKKGFQDLFKMPRRITFVLAIKDTRVNDSALCYDQGRIESLEESIKKAVGDDTDFVLEKLQENKYIMKGKSCVVSDKFVMKATKNKFADEMYSSTKTADMKYSGVKRTQKQKLRKKDWEEVYDALTKQVPKTKSTVVRMELLHLFSYFSRYQLGRGKFQLKICFIPDSNANLGEDLKKFLHEKA